MELQAMHFTFLFIVLVIGVLRFMQTSSLIKLSLSMLLIVISFVSPVESKSALELFFCDKVFCSLFIVVRVVLLSFVWLLYEASAE